MAIGNGPDARDAQEYAPPAGPGDTAWRPPTGTMQRDIAVQNAVDAADGELKPLARNCDMTVNLAVYLFRTYAGSHSTSSSP